MFAYLILLNFNLEKKDNNNTNNTINGSIGSSMLDITNNNYINTTMGNENENNNISAIVYLNTNESQKEPGQRKDNIIYQKSVKIKKDPKEGKDSKENNESKDKEMNQNQGLSVKDLKESKDSKDLQKDVKIFNKHKQPSQSCNTNNSMLSEKSKKGQRLIDKTDKIRPFKRNEQNNIPNSNTNTAGVATTNKTPKINNYVNNQNNTNNQNITNTEPNLKSSAKGLKIEREVEVSILSSKGDTKGTQSKCLISSNDSPSNQSRSQNPLKNTFRESELNKTDDNEDNNFDRNIITQPNANVSNMINITNNNESLIKKENEEILSKQNNSSSLMNESKRKIMNESVLLRQNQKESAIAKRKKILEYDKSLKNEKSNYKPVFTEESLVENRENKAKNKKLPLTQSIKQIKKSKPPVPEISEEELNNNRTKLIEDYEVRILKETRKQLLTETSKNNEKNAKKISCLREKNLLENVLHTPKLDDENEEEVEEGERLDEDGEQINDTRETKKKKKKSEDYNIMYDNSRITNSHPIKNSQISQESDLKTYKSKERVDPNEYMKKIYESIEETCEVENSFRKSFSLKLRKRDKEENSNMSSEFKVNYQTRLITEYDDIEVKKAKKKFPENYKEDLKYFMSEKKLQLKEIKIKEENEKLEKTMKIYAGLYNINEKIKEDFKVI